MTEPLAGEAGDDDSGLATASPGSLQERAALVLFLLFCLGAGAYILGVAGRDQWFFGDEWDPLTTRSLFDFRDLFRPHNEHLTALPNAIYRVVYYVVGLHNYTAYQVPVVVARLATALLVRQLLRCMRVSPWLSSLFAASWILYGPGSENIVWAFQVTFVGSMAFGLGQLFLVQRDPSTLRRQFAALAAGMGALLCSGLGVVFVIAVGVFLALRRRWREAFVQTVPLGLGFGLWFAAYRPASRVPRAPAARALGWVGEAVVGSVLEMGGSTMVGGVIAVIVICGVGLGIRTIGLGAFFTRAAPAVSLLVAWGLFLLATGFSRAAIQASPTSSRYADIGFLLVLPTIGLAVDSLVTAFGKVAFLAALPLAFVMPFHATSIKTEPFHVAVFPAQQRLIFGLPDYPATKTVPRWVRPDSQSFVGAVSMTTGWILDAKAGGYLPEPPPPSILVDSTFKVRLGLAPVDVPAKTACVTYDRPIELREPLGTQISFERPVSVAAVIDDSGARSWPLGFSPAYGATVEVTLPDLVLVVAPSPGSLSFVMCR